MCKYGEFFAADNLPYEKVGKNEPVCIADEVPFDIPDTWEWVRLSTANDMYTGNSINENEKKQKYTGLSDGYFYIGTKDVGFDHTINYDNGVRIPYDNEKFRIAPQNSILLCVEGGSAGRKISFTNQDVCFGNKLCCFVSFGVDYKFLYYYFQSPLFQSAFKENTTGIIGGVSVNTLKSMFLPIPPLNEQLRIVKEITKLEPFIDGYRIAEENLAKLNLTFPEFLKKSILQEAVQGKLVPQDPNDEPASVLLERIRAEKEQLIKEGKIKKDKHESVIFRRDNSHYEKCGNEEVYIDDCTPFEIPESWVWTRLENIVTKEIKRGKSPQYANTSNILVFAQKCNVKTGGIDMSLAKFLSPVTFSKYPTEEIMQNKDIVINSTGRGTLGRIGIFSDSDRINSFPIVPDSHVTIVRTSENFAEKYLYYVLKYYQPYLEGLGEGSTNQTELKPAVISKLLIPVPPYSEQMRIVHTLEQVLARTGQI